MRFAGVSVDTLLAEAGPAANAAYVLARPYTGYTTNLPLDDATGGRHGWRGT
jgi:DMSO/TMAO reductase YedYZ molybdopterin-dependent catalytic subunit